MVPMDKQIEAYVKSDMYIELAKSAMEQNLVLFPYKYTDSAGPNKDNGIYIIISPNEKYKHDLADYPGGFTRLLNEKRQMGEREFNPCYNIINISDVLRNANQFHTYMTICHEIENSSTCINAFRNLGYDDYPSIMSRQACDELKGLKDKCEDPYISYPLREKIEKAYEKMSAYVYHQFKKAGNEYMRPKTKTQKVGKDYFINNSIPAMTDTVNNVFKDYLLSQISRYPDFYYYMDDKHPVAHYEATDNLRVDGAPGHNPYAKEKELYMYEITFPRDKQDEFYKILMEFNTRIHHTEHSLTALGNYDELTTIRINYRDLDQFDNLMQAAGIKYYINKGDMEYMDSHATLHPLVAINRNDGPNVQEICMFMMRSAVSHREFDKQNIAEVNKKYDAEHEKLVPNTTVVGEPHPDRLKVNASLKGYTDLSH